MSSLSALSTLDLTPSLRASQVLGLSMGYERPKNEGVAPMSFPSQFIDAFRPMVDGLHAPANNLTFSINSRKVNAGNGALQVYAIAKRGCA
jgi:hypothetical protein